MQNIKYKIWLSNYIVYKIMHSILVTILLSIFKKLLLAVNRQINQRGTKRQVYKGKSLTEANVWFSSGYYFSPKTHISPMWFATLIWQTSKNKASILKATFFCCSIRFCICVSYNGAPALWEISSFDKKCLKSGKKMGSRLSLIISKIICLY